MRPLARCLFRGNHGATVSRRYRRGAMNQADRYATENRSLRAVKKAIVSARGYCDRLQRLLKQCTRKPYNDFGTVNQCSWCYYYTPATVTRLPPHELTPTRLTWCACIFLINSRSHGCSSITICSIRCQERTFEQQSRNQHLRFCETYSDCDPVFYLICYFFVEKVAHP